MPADVDVNRGTMFSDAYLDENLFFSGAYQVTKVESSMNQGQFVQTLTMVRLNNQTGTGQNPDLRKAAIDGAIGSIKGDSMLPPSLRNTTGKVEDIIKGKVDNAKDIAKEKFEGLI